KTLVFVNHGLSKRLGREESLRRIRMFRNHPAMLVWYEEEAVVRGIHPLSWLKEYVDDVRREGPGHPVLIGDQSAEGAKVKDRGWKGAGGGRRGGRRRSGGGAGCAGAGGRRGRGGGAGGGGVPEGGGGR